MAVIYESLLLIGPLLVIAFFYSVFVNFTADAGTALYTVKRFGLQITLAVALLAYFVYGWSKGRCTLPMQTLGLGIETVRGEPLTAMQALIRALLAFPSTVTGIGFLWALIDGDSQSLHDRLAKTRLIFCPPRPPSAPPDRT